MEDINVSSLWRETDKSHGKLMNFYWDTTELNKISLVTLPEGYCWLLCRVLWQDSMAWRLKVRGSWGDWIFISLWSTLKWRMQPWKPKTIAVSCKDQTPRGPYMDVECLGVGIPLDSTPKHWADLSHGEPDARGWRCEAAKLPSLNKWTFSIIRQPINFKTGDNKYFVVKPRPICQRRT